MEKMVEGERILPLVLKYNLKPARIPDMSSFKSPQNWIGNLSVAKSDRSRIKFLLGEQADADLLAKAPRVTVGGDTYYMLPDVMREGMDPELWKDLKKFVKNLYKSFVQFIFKAIYSQFINC